MEEGHKRKLKQLYRHIALWTLVALFVGGGVLGMVKLASRQAKDTGAPITVDAINSEDWVRGNPAAKVILIEYSDLQCPACAFYYPVLKKLEEEFGDKLAVVYRHFPLPIHQNAKPAAYAAEAAGRQGKFWEMHDLIFESQKEWKDRKDINDVMKGYAQRLNLNTDQFTADFTSKEIREKVEVAYRSAISLGLNSTPTFFLNGKKISNPRNYEDFRNVLLQAINEPR